MVMKNRRKDRHEEMAPVSAPAANDETAPPEPKKRRRFAFGKRLMVIGFAVVLPVAVLGGLAASGGFQSVIKLVTGSSKDEGKKASKDLKLTDAALPYNPDAPTVLLPVGEIIVNMAPAPGQAKGRFLKIGVGLVIDQTVEEASKQKTPYIKDSFQEFLRQMDDGEVAGTAGLIRLRMELLRRSRAILGDNAVREVLITDLLVQ
jgi:flagellar FliL protein